MSSPLHFVEHEINDNTILTNKKPDQTNRKTVLFGAEKVTVGITNPNRRVIKVDPVTGLNYETDATETYEVYNLRKQHHGNFFLLDLETGVRGWYPGSKKIGDINTADVPIKAATDDTSETVVVTSLGDTVDIGDSFHNGTTLWYYVTFGEYTGYVKAAYISNIRYIDRV